MIDIEFFSFLHTTSLPVDSIVYEVLQALLCSSPSDFEFDSFLHTTSLSVDSIVYEVLQGLLCFSLSILFITSVSSTLSSIVFKSFGIKTSWSVLPNKLSLSTINFSFPCLYGVLVLSVFV